MGSLLRHVPLQIMTFCKLSIVTENYQQTKGRFHKKILKPNNDIKHGEDNGSMAISGLKSVFEVKNFFKKPPHPTPNL